MNDHRVNISSQAEFNPDHYRFPRTSGLPAGTFDDDEANWGDRFVLAVCAVAVVVIVLMIAGVIA